ncbi:MAG TPA: hypothetical protein VMM81_06945 [Acidimicrobiia bacterium]|nr:hypothetical protein [Acidimicrobiia bacterium]
MKRIERRILAIADQIAALDEQLRLTREELVIHQHLDDDARRDAAVGGPIEREDARITGADVARFQAVADRLERELARLQEKHATLLSRLD